MVIGIRLGCIQMAMCLRADFPENLCLPNTGVVSCYTEETIFLIQSTSTLSTLALNVPATS